MSNTRLVDLIQKTGREYRAQINRREFNPNDFPNERVSLLAKRYLDLIQGRLCSVNNEHIKVATALAKTEETTAINDTQQKHMPSPLDPDIPLEAKQDNEPNAPSPHEQWLELAQRLRLCEHGALTTNYLELLEDYFGLLHWYEGGFGTVTDIQTLFTEMVNKINDDFNSLSAANELQEYNPTNSQTTDAEHWSFLTDRLKRLNAQNRLSETIVKAYEKLTNKKIRRAQHGIIKSPAELADNIMKDIYPALVSQIQNAGHQFIVFTKNGGKRLFDPKNFPNNAVAKIAKDYLKLIDTRWRSSHPTHKKVANKLKAWAGQHAKHAKQVCEQQAKQASEPKTPSVNNLQSPHKQWLNLAEALSSCKHGKLSGEMIGLFEDHFGHLDHNHPHTAKIKSTGELAREMETEINDYFTSFNIAKELKDYVPPDWLRDDHPHWEFLIEQLRELKEPRGRLTKTIFNLFRDGLGISVTLYTPSGIQSPPELAHDIKAAMDLQQAPGMEVYPNAIELGPLRCSAAAEPAPPPPPPGGGPQALGPAAASE